uniref:Uncharacterized protein n=1 Tax=Oryza brachyantha TaxID=4533 RepID=J3MEV6_ORYBR
MFGSPLEMLSSRVILAKDDGGKQHGERRGGIGGEGGGHDATCHEVLVEQRLGCHCPPLFFLFHLPDLDCPSVHSSNDDLAKLKISRQSGHFQNDHGRKKYINLFFQFL